MPDVACASRALSGVGGRHSLHENFKPTLRLTGRHPAVLCLKRTSESTIESVSERVHTHTHTHKAVSLLQVFHGIMLIEEEEKSRHQGIKVLAASDFLCSIIKHNAAVAFIDLLPPQKNRAAVRKSKNPFFLCVCLLDQY